MLVEKVKHTFKRRAPYGARGLKYHNQYAPKLKNPVAPRMGRVD